MPVGQIVGRMNEIRPVADIIAELVAGFEAATERLDGIRRAEPRCAADPKSEVHPVDLPVDVAELRHLPAVSSTPISALIRASISELRPSTSSALSLCSQPDSSSRWGRIAGRRAQHR